MRAPFAVRLGIAFYAVAEVGLLVLAVQWLGGWPTFLLVLATSLLGGWIILTTGVNAFGSLEDAVRAGRAPDARLADAGLVMTGGLLLVLPGFITDVAGALTVLPATRPLVRRVLRRVGLAARRPPPVGSGPVIRGEVVDPTDDGRRRGMADGPAPPDSDRPRPPIPPPGPDM
ncbi:MAG TPA: FxsA family protein [Jiangellaceae bacterium]|nr:FxsA family protein [Jiangellaceae bacterium]